MSQDLLDVRRDIEVSLRTPPYADVVWRFLATLIDAIVFLAFAAGWTFAWGLFWFPILARLQPAEMGLVGPVLALGFIPVAGACYSVLMESAPWQGTLGKLATRINVTDLRGRRLTRLRALGRLFAKCAAWPLSYLNYLLMTFTPRMQGLHDLLSGTLVVDRERRPPASGEGTPAPRPEPAAPDAFTPPNRRL